MRALQFAVILGIATAMVSPAQAETSAFTDATGNHLWSDADNWSEGIPDGPADVRDDYAFLSEGLLATGHYAAIDYAAPSLWAIRLGQEGPNTRLVLAAGGRLTVGHLLIGSTSHSGAVFDAQGGELRCTQSFTVSHRGDPGGDAVLRGGVVSAARLAIGVRGRVDVRGGRLEIDGDQRAALDDHRAARRLVAYGNRPGARLVIAYDADADTTTVSARGGPPPEAGCAEGRGRPLTVALMGDPQLHMNEDSLRFVTMAMDDIGGLEHDFVVPLGDLVQNRAEYYADYREIVLDPSPTPVYSIAGNADRNAGLDAYMAGTGLPLTYVVRERGVRFIFLSVVETSGGGNHICHMGPDQVAWLRAELDADTTSTTAVFFHAPVFETTYRSGDRAHQPPPMSLYLDESGALQALFRQHANVRFYASAHIHPFRYGREDDEGRGGYAEEDGVLYAIVGTSANNKGSRLLYVDSGQMFVRVRDHENTRWLDDYQRVHAFETSLQPEVDRVCADVGDEREGCPDGCGERIRQCDPFTCTWSQWSTCAPCPVDASVEPALDARVEPPPDQGVPPDPDATREPALDQGSADTSGAPTRDATGPMDRDATPPGQPDAERPSRDAAPVADAEAAAAEPVAGGCYCDGGGAPSGGGLLGVLLLAAIRRRR